VRDTGSRTPVKPLAFGYLAFDVGDEHEVVGWALGELIAAVAKLEGYCLADVFSDVRGVSESGLHSMVEALHRGEAVAVIVAELTHLQHVGCLAGADLATAARFLRARLIVAGFCAGTTQGRDLVRAAVGTP
jgi:hypothetical protein